MQRDPVTIARRILIDWEVLDDTRADEIEATVKQEVLDAFAWAAEQPLCTLEDGLKHVFVEGVVEARQFCLSRIPIAPGDNSNAKQELDVCGPRGRAV